MRGLIFYRIEPPGTVPRLVRLGTVWDYDLTEAVQRASREWPDAVRDGEPYNGFAAMTGGGLRQDGPALVRVADEDRSRHLPPPDADGKVAVRADDGPAYLTPPRE